MNISNKYVLVTKFEEEAKVGFKTIEVQDNYVYKARVKQLPEIPVYADNRQLVAGDVVLFAKYSPDTHEIDLDGVKVKFVAISDILAVI